MSSSNINHVVMTGRLTSDPDLRALPSGASVCHLRIAVNVRRRDAGGEWGNRPNFFDVVVFGANGENVARYMHKGSAVAIDGRLDWREWEASDGHMAQAVSILARTVQFLDSPRSAADGPLVGDDGEDNSPGLRGIDGDDEENLDFADQEAIAAAAA